MRKVNNSKTGVSKGPVINKVSVGPEDIVLGHDTFCIHFVGSLHKINHLLGHNIFHNMIPG